MASGCLHWCAILLALISSTAPLCCSASRPSPSYKHATGTAFPNQLQCMEASPYVKITAITSSSLLEDEEIVLVTVDGVTKPGPNDWVGMFTPSLADLNFCPSVRSTLKESGVTDVKHIPAVCTVPVKAQYLSEDNDYLGCRNRRCANLTNNKCTLWLCSATLRFDVINIRSDIEFALFTGGFDKPCVVSRTEPLSFQNPYKPLHSHISAIDSTGTALRVTWVSGDNGTQAVKYGYGDFEETMYSTAARISKDDMCGNPAKGLGWHDPGFVHTAVMIGLKPGYTYNYTYGSDVTGWSESINFRSLPKAGYSNLEFIVVADMGKSPRDSSFEHAMQPAAAGVLDTIVRLELPAPDNPLTGIDSMFHLGGISFASGFMIDWDYFLRFIEPVASKVPYMTAIGSAERDFSGSGSVYGGKASGGECGVPYEAHFQMPIQGPDKPWYSVEQGPVHFTVISTENPWKLGSEQYKWIEDDLVKVDRTMTPWVIVAGHRPMYSSSMDDPSMKLDPEYAENIEAMLVANKVDLVLSGHTRHYERTCNVYHGVCLNYPVGSTAQAHDTYKTGNYTAPVHVTVSTAGTPQESLSQGPVPQWSVVRLEGFGYLRLSANPTELSVWFVDADGDTVDSFSITKADYKQ